MPDDELTPWEQKEQLEEFEEEVRARGLPSDTEWDGGGGKSQIVNPASAPYPPPYDPGQATNVDGDGDE